MSTLDDLKYAKVNVTGLSLNDELFIWLGVQGGSGATVTDREFSMLKGKGAFTGTLLDMWYQYLGVLGHTQPALADRQMAFWAV